MEQVLSILPWLVAAFLAHVFIRARAKRTPVIAPPPGNHGYPIVGETFSLFTTHPAKFVRDRRKEYGDMFSSYLINNPTIVVSSVEDNKFFLEQDGANFCNASKLKSMRMTLGPHQVNQVNDDLHRRFYKLILSHMVPEALKAKVQDIDKAAQSVLVSLCKGVPAVMKPELEKFTFLSIAALVCDQLEQDPNAVTTQTVLHDIRTVAQGIVSLPVNLPFFTYFKALQARKRLACFFKDVIAQRLRDGSTHRDLLQTLLDSEEDGGKLSLEQVVDNVIACLFAGHHTTALTLVWTMKFIHEHPQILYDLKEEHKRIIERKGTKTYVLTWEDTQEMHFTWMVVQEALRLSSIPPAVIREIKQDIIYQGFMFPKGWNIILNFSANHMNEQHFPKPGTFNPYRFKVTPKRGTFTPFGAGSRTCAGRELAKLEMLIFIHRLVTGYRWEPVATAKARVNYQMLPTIEDGYPVRVTSERTENCFETILISNA